MFRTSLPPLGATAVSLAALSTITLIAPGAALAQKTITIVIPEEPDSLDNCNSARSAVGRVIRQNVNETLIELDPNDSSLKPRLATSWKQVNATTWRFTLRKGIKYSDGTPLTPEAISSAVDKALSPKLDCNARTKMFSGFTIKVVKVDDATIDIVTPEPDPILPVRMAMVLITHDLGVVAEVADHVAVMYGGRVVESGPARDVLSRPAHPYTLALLESVPRADVDQQQLSPIVGSPPDMATLPTGCSFHPRCPRATDQCRASLPPSVEMAPGHHAECFRAREVFDGR